MVLRVIALPGLYSSGLTWPIIRTCLEVRLPLQPVAVSERVKI